MNTKKKAEIAGCLLGLTGAFAGKGLDAFPWSICLLLTSVCVWSVVILHGWFTFTKTTWGKCVGYGVIAAAFLVAVIFMPNGEANARDPGPVVRRPDPIAMGNLRQRASELTDEILTDLHRHGYSDPRWKKANPASVIELMPESDSKYPDWLRERQLKFKHSYLRGVRILRDEFAQLHLRNRDLDDSLGEFDPNRVTEHEIADVAFDLMQLSDELPEAP